MIRLTAVITHIKNTAQKIISLSVLHHTTLLLILHYNFATLLFYAYPQNTSAPPLFIIVRLRTIIEQYIFTVNEIILKFVSHTIAMYEIIW